MKKTLRPLLILLLSLSVLMGTTASAWAAPGGHWWINGRNNHVNMYINNHNTDNNKNWNYGNQNSGHQNQGNQQNNVSDSTYGGTSFSDVPSWAQGAVGQMARLGIIKGVGRGLFGSGQSITRAQLAVLLSREFDLSVSGSTYNVTFADVPSTFWAYQYIGAATPYMDYWNGSNGTYLFHPTDPAVREDIIASMVEAAGLGSQTPDTSVLSKFVDAGGISPDLTNLVAIAVQNGLITGSQDSSGNWHLYPQASVTRVEAAVLLSRALRYGVAAPPGVSGSVYGG